MNASIWKSLSGCLIAILIIQNILLWRYSNSSTTAAPAFSLPSLSPAHPDWTYSTERDASNHALSTAQCSKAFPDLYYEIDRAVKYWQENNHTITPQDIEISWRRDAAFRVLIHENQVRILESKKCYEDYGYRKRTIAVLSQLHRAILGATAAGETFPTVEFSVTVDDMALLPTGNDTHAIWSFTRRLVDRVQDRQWVMPDFNFWAWPPAASSFHDMRSKAAEQDGYLFGKIPKAVWRGVRWTNKDVRGSLLDNTADKPWADVQEINWNDRTNFITMEDHCKYMFAVHTEGRSWSGRLKYLLNCDTVPIVHDLDFATHYYHLLEDEGPKQNYVRVKRDFSDLEEKVNHYLEHPTEAQMVAYNAVNTFRSRYTTPAAEACYWRRMMTSWQEVAFKPEPYEEVERNMSGVVEKQRQLRGITFEEFLVLEDNYPAEIRTG